MAWQNNLVARHRPLEVDDGASVGWDTTEEEEEATVGAEGGTVEGVKVMEEEAAGMAEEGREVGEEEKEEATEGVGGKAAAVEG